MKLVKIRLVLLCLSLLPVPVFADADKNELNRSYQKLYHEVLMTQPIELKDSSIPKQYRRNIRYKIFYRAGYYRGLLEYSSYEGFKKGKGIGMFHNTRSGMNLVEFEGWLVGCELGQKKGKLVEDKVLQAYLKKIRENK